MSQSTIIILLNTTIRFTYLRIAKEAKTECLVHLKEHRLAANCRYDDNNSLLALEFLNRPNLHRLVALSAEFLSNLLDLTKLEKNT